MNSDKSRSISSSTVLTEVVAPEYESVNPEVDALLLQASQQFESTVLALRITRRVIKRITGQQTADLDHYKEKVTLNSYILAHVHAPTYVLKNVHIRSYKIFIDASQVLNIINSIKLLCKELSIQLMVHACMHATCMYVTGTYYMIFFWLYSAYIRMQLLLYTCLHKRIITYSTAHI